MMLSLKAIYWLKIKHITFIIYSTSALLASTIANGLVIDGRVSMLCLIISFNLIVFVAFIS